MKTVKGILIAQSTNKNVWALSLEQEEQLIKTVSSELFVVSPDLVAYVIKSAKVTCFMIQQGKLNAEYVVFEFINYILGGLFSENTNGYSKVKEQVVKNLPGIINHNLATLNKDIVKKYLTNFQVEYDFIFNNNLNPKKIC